MQWLVVFRVDDVMVAMEWLVVFRVGDVGVPIEWVIVFHVLQVTANSFMYEAWGAAVEQKKNFPFTEGKKFTVRIECESSCYKVQTNLISSPSTFKDVKNRTWKR